MPVVFSEGDTDAMWVGIVLSAALAVVTITMAYLGFHVTLHPAESAGARRLYKAAFSLCALVAVSLVVWQEVRNGMGQQRLQTEIGDAKTEAQNIREDLKLESARRQQAEKDLALMVQSAGQATRAGVAEDIRKTPISVRPVPVNQQKMGKLAELVQMGNAVRSKVPARAVAPPFPDGDPWIKDVNDWWGRTEAFLRANCTPQALVAASDLSRMISMSYGGIASDEKVQSTFRNLDRLVGNLTELLKRPDLCP